MRGRFGTRAAPVARPRRAPHGRPRAHRGRPCGYALGPGGSTGGAGSRSAKLPRRTFADVSGSCSSPALKRPLWRFRAVCGARSRPSLNRPRCSFSGVGGRTLHAGAEAADVGLVEHGLVSGLLVGGHRRLHSVTSFVRGSLRDAALRSGASGLGRPGQNEDTVSRPAQPASWTVRPRGSTPASGRRVGPVRHARLVASRARAPRPAALRRRSAAARARSARSGRRG